MSRSAAVPAPSDHVIQSLPVSLDRASVPATHPFTALSNALITGQGLAPSGTLKAWATAHDMQTVHTLQVHPRGAWSPGGRKMIASATYATLDGSRRDYGGTTVLHSDDSTIVFTYDWGGPAYVIWTTIDPHAAN